MSVVADTVPNLRPVRPSRPPRRKPSPVERRSWAGLLLLTAGLHLWDLGSVGWADGYRAGAVRGMAQDWTAFLFGSTDAGNLVTVEMPPGSLWVMALSARVFGFSSWSMLVPQALMGVAAVALLGAAVRRVAGPGAGLLAGAALALTPAVVATFRDNGPDALLVLLLVAAAHATVRAVEAARTRWLLMAGALVGSAFLTDPAQALVPLPALALAYLAAAPTARWRRLLQLLAVGVAVVVAGGWWYALVELRPAATRPYIGGSRTDSALELALGPGGLGRIAGTGPGLRLDAQTGVLVGWLLPAVLALLLIGLVLTGRAARTDPTRASLLLWGGWTVTTALLLGIGDYGPTDTAVLAPGLAASAGIGSALLWERRRRWAGRGTLALLVAATVAWAWMLLDRTPELVPRWVLVTVVAVVIGVVLLGAAISRRGAAAVGVTLALMALAGPAVHAAHAAATGGRGATPTATADPALTDLLRSTGRTWSAATVGAQNSAALALASDTTVMGIGGLSGSDPAPTLEEFQAIVASGEVRWFVDQGPSGGSAIPSWVQQTFESTTVGDHTIYDLAKPRP
ncbi:glycosyltransferase family 39 protein [Pseudonocardia adelaidensis]|uniref:Glycosyltransferase family 39 protein n=1 Tax=Pseudonocardia adelaidensis TaxID=648754 RepID=A0ABP9N563_9PSEU